MRCALPCCHACLISSPSLNDPHPNYTPVDAVTRHLLVFALQIASTVAIEIGEIPDPGQIVLGQLRAAEELSRFLTSHLSCRSWRCDGTVIAHVTLTARHRTAPHRTAPLPTAPLMQRELGSIPVQYGGIQTSARSCPVPS